MVVLRRLRAVYGPATWRRLLYLVAAVPLGALGFCFAVVAVVPGAVLSVTVAGLPVLAGGVLAARAMGALHRALARTLLGVTVQDPPRFQPAPGRLGWIRSGLVDATGWRALLYLLVKGPLDLAAAYLCVPVWVGGLFYLSYPLWWWALPVSYDSRGQPHRGDFAIWEGFYFDTWPRVLLLAAAGAALVLAAPWVTRAVLWPTALLTRALLRPTRASRLQATRALAVDDAAARLRRIERDLHDGAQVQLVALAMNLGLAQQEFRDGNTQAGMALIDGAHASAKRAVADLRDLARGIHPPVLDGGLAPALHTLASLSAVPVDLHVALPDRPSPAIETIAYFSAAELLTNVAKHSQAGYAAVTLTMARPGWLRLTVRDDGAGGATSDGAHPGGGLAGLADRIRTVDGRIDVSSPPGGPTVVVVELPVRA